VEDDDRAQVAREGRNGHRKDSSDYGKAWRTMIGHKLQGKDAMVIGKSQVIMGRRGGR